MHEKGIIVKPEGATAIMEGSLRFERVPFTDGFGLSASSPALNNADQ
jgi:hypothetical protein